MSETSGALKATPIARGRAPQINAVVDNFGRLVRMFNRSRAQLVQNARVDGERAAQLLLRSLQQNGPMRVSALAESVGCDPSTVSRQVSSLVAEGLLERRADQADGRACLLGPTEAGHAVIARNQRTREDFYEGMLADWSVEDLDTFAALLDRFSHAYENATDGWLSDGGSRRMARSGSRAR